MALEKSVANRFTLTAVINGKTIFSQVKLDAGSKPLLQFLDKSTGALTQPWESDGPSFHAEAKDSNGKDYVVKNPVLYWNDTIVEFDDDGNSQSFPGDQNGTIARSVDASGVTHYKIMHEIFGLDGTPLNNPNSDDFYITGIVSLPGGNSQKTQTQRETVVCVLSSMGGNTIYGIVESTDIADGADSSVQNAHLYSSSNGQEIVSTTEKPVTYKWFNISGNEAKECVAADGYVLTNNNKTLTVPKSAVNGDELFRCDMTYNGETVSAYGTVHDFNDPYYIRLTETGKGGASDHMYAHIQEDETVTVQADIVDKDGNVKTGTGLKPEFHVTKADGSVWTEKCTANAKEDTASVDFTYNEIVYTAGGQGQGYVTAEK